MKSWAELQQELCDCKNRLAGATNKISYTYDTSNICNVDGPIVLKLINIGTGEEHTMMLSNDTISSFQLPANLSGNFKVQVIATTGDYIQISVLDINGVLLVPIATGTATTFPETIETLGSFDIKKLSKIVFGCQSSG